MPLWRNDTSKDEDAKELLPQREGESESQMTARTSRLSRLKIPALTATIAIITIAVLGFIIYYSSLPRHLKDCSGLSIEERALACRFDIMSFSWLPPACFDGELIEEFNRVKEWGYWEHKKGVGGQVPMEEAQKGLRDLYVSWDHHRHHCIYMWKKLHRAVVSGRPIDSYVGNYGHTKHCERMLFSEETSNLSIALINSPILIKTPFCGLENWNIPAQLFVKSE